MKQLLTLAFASVLLAACTHTSGDARVKRTNRVEEFTFRTTGDPGQSFVARLNLDGEEREISGTSPAEYVLRACVLTGTVTRTDGTGKLSFEIASPNRSASFGSAPVSHFRYHDGGVEVWN